MSDLLNKTANKRQNSDSIFKVNPFPSQSFGVQAKSAESVPTSKAELWESYQQAKQLNQGTHRSPMPIQAKLKIGQPGDKYEQEADSVADRVMGMPEPVLAKSTVTNSVQTRSSIEPIQRVSTDAHEQTTEEPKQEDGEQIHAKAEIGKTLEISTTSAKIAEIPNEPTIQRDSPGSLPKVPNYQLTTPSLGQPQDPSSRYKIGGDMSLQLDPQFQLIIQHVQEQVNISTIRTAISQIDLAVPVTYNPTPDHSQLLALPPKPGSKPTQSSDSEATKSEHVDTPDSPGAADASAKPRAGSMGDLLTAGFKAFEKPITFLHTQVKDRLPRDFSKLQAGDIVVGIVTVVPIGAGLLRGLLPNPAARQFALEQLNGKVLPVPGLPWFHLEMNSGKKNLMVGCHVNLGMLLLPSSLGFKGSSPDAIGGPPEPEPFPVQRKSDSIGDIQPSSNLEDRLNGSKGGGSPLSDDVRSFMEPRFGADFSGVRVHTGSNAVQMNRDVNAQAFAHGQDIYFGEGKAPGNDALTAHELTHVVQQTNEIQRQQHPATTPSTSPIVSSPELETTLQNIENAYSSAYGVHSRQLMAMTAFYTDINVSDPPTPTEQALTVAVSATLGSATAFIGLRIANGIARSLTGSASTTFIANQITDNCKDQGKLAAQRSLRSSGGNRDARFRFHRALVDGIMQSSMTATETFNNHKESYRTNQNGLEEAHSLLNSLHTQMQNAYDLQYAQAAAQWSTLQTNWVGLSGDRGTLVLQIRCARPGSDVQIVESTLEGLNQAARASLSGLSTVSIRELGLSVRVEGENPNWIFETSHSSDNISITGNPGQIPNFQHSGNTAYFLISRGIAKYGFQPESIQNIPDPLQETSAILMFNEILAFPLSRLGNLGG
jgi:hypothetical protein